MKTVLSFAVLAFAIGFTGAPADAKGCLKGAAVGGVAGQRGGRLCDRAPRGEKKGKNNANQQPQ